MGGQGRRSKPRLDRVIAENEQRMSLASVVEMVEDELPDILKTMARAAKGEKIEATAVTAGTAILNLVTKHLSERADSRGKDIIREIRKLRELNLQQTLAQGNNGKEASPVGTD